MAFASATGRRPADVTMYDAPEHTPLQDLRNLIVVLWYDVCYGFAAGSE